jgi:hypothetical protein
MLRLSVTRILSISKIAVKTPTCLFHSSSCVLQNSTSQSDENTVNKNEKLNRTKYVLYLLTIFSHLQLEIIFF